MTVQWGTNQSAHCTFLLLQKQTGLFLQSKDPAEGKFDQSYNEKDPQGERKSTLCSLTQFIDESPRVASVINYTIKAGVCLDRSCDCRQSNTIKADSAHTSDLLITFFIDRLFVCSFFVFIFYYFFPLKLQKQAGPPPFVPLSFSLLQKGRS